jgi:hypothetical protein
MIEHCTVITDIENGLGNEKKEKKFWQRKQINEIAKKKKRKLKETSLYFSLKRNVDTDWALFKCLVFSSSLWPKEIHPYVSVMVSAGFLWVVIFPL